MGKALSTRDFFENLIPLMAAQNPGYRTERGSIAFVVHGDGEWTFRFGQVDERLAIIPGIDFDADLMLLCSRQSFHRLLAGECPELNLGFAMEGDVTLLERFNNLLDRRDVPS